MIILQSVQCVKKVMEELMENVSSVQRIVNFVKMVFVESVKKDLKLMKVDVKKLKQKIVIKQKEKNVNSVKFTIFYKMVFVSHVLNYFLIVFTVLTRTKMSVKTADQVST